MDPAHNTHCVHVRRSGFESVAVSWFSPAAGLCVVATDAKMLTGLGFSRPPFPCWMQHEHAHRRREAVHSSTVDHERTGTDVRLPPAGDDPMRRYQPGFFWHILGFLRGMCHGAGAALLLFVRGSHVILNVVDRKSATDALPCGLYAGGTSCRSRGQAAAL